MEPTDLNSKSPDDAQIDASLRAGSAVSPLPDDGFSARVLAALPPARTRLNSSLRAWLCAAGALIGGIVAASSSGTGPDASEQFASMIASVRTSLAPLADPSVMLA